MKKYVYALLFAIAFLTSFSFLESRTVVFRTLMENAYSLTNKEPQQATLLFVGDLMFDRYIRTVLERSKEDVILADVASLLLEADLTIGNLEGPVTAYPSQSQGTKVGDQTNMRFTFSPLIPELLRRHGFDLVSIGNNHINDFGAEGVQSTTKYLTAAGLAYVGDPSGQSPEPVIQTVDGITIAFVAYSDFVGGDAARARMDIQSISADVVVVLAHWGNEYEREPPPRVRELARSFAEAGADLIIGSHPHVIGLVEDIGTTRVYYSLGNFVFDQYWESQVRCGLTVEATIDKSGEAVRVRYDETKVGMKNTGATVLGCDEALH